MNLGFGGLLGLRKLYFGGIIGILRYLDGSFLVYGVLDLDLNDC